MLRRNIDIAAIALLALFAVVLRDLPLRLPDPKKIAQQAAQVERRLGDIEHRVMVLGIRLEEVGRRLEARLDATGKRIDRRFNRCGKRIDINADKTGQRLECAAKRLIPFASVVNW